MSDLWAGRSELQEVVPRVFITNFFGAKNKKKLLNHNISHVVNCTADLPCPFEKEQIDYKRIPVADNTHVMISEYFDETCEWIDNILAASSANNVLIHCAAGSSRSGTISIAYMVHQQPVGERNLQKCIETLTAARPIVLPNPGYLEQLETWCTNLS